LIGRNPINLASGRENQILIPDWAYIFPLSWCYTTHFLRGVLHSFFILFQCCKSLNNFCFVEPHKTFGHKLTVARLEGEDELVVVVLLQRRFTRHLFPLQWSPHLKQKRLFGQGEEAKLPMAYLEIACTLLPVPVVFWVGIRKGCWGRVTNSKHCSWRIFIRKNWFILFLVKSF